MNRGLVSRRAHVTQSRVVDMMGRPHVDLFLQYQRRRRQYTTGAKQGHVRAMAGGGNLDYKVHIVNATMFATKATLNPTVQMAHIKALDKGTAKYPLRSVDCKVYSIPTGAMSYTHENLFLGTLPKHLVLCCIDNDVQRVQRFVREEPVSRQAQQRQLPRRLRGWSTGTLQTSPAEFRRESIHQKLPQPVHLDWQGITGRRERSDS